MMMLLVCRRAAGLVLASNLGIGRIASTPLLAVKSDGEFESKKRGSRALPPP
jgi:hypothetical protein